MNAVARKCDGKFMEANMRRFSSVLACAAGWFVVSMLAAQDEPAPMKLNKRFGFEVDQFQFPQKAPKEALQSAVKALEARRVNYLIAQLADPAYVDGTIAEYKKFFQKGTENAKQFLAFDRLVREVTGYYTEDPELLNELRRFVKEGEWDAKEEKASATVKALPGRQVFMRKLEGRWFLENRQQ